MTRKIFFNGLFYTFDPSYPRAEAVVIEDGRFLDMGRTEDMLLQWGRAGVRKIDLEQKTVTPGFTDSHLHLSMLTRKFTELDLTGVASKAEVLRAVQEKTKELAPGEWVVGNGWDENVFTDGGVPTKEELDRVAPNHPVFLRRVCHHAAVANSQAFQASNIQQNVEVPEGGVVVTNEAGEPTGLLLDYAQDLIQEHIPEPSYETWKKVMRQTIQFLLEKGMTSAHTNDPLYMGGLAQTYRLYDELLNGENLGLRCHLLIDYPFLDDLRQAGMYAGYGNETLQIGAVKMFADGAFGQSTALLSEPYANEPGHYGEAMVDQETLYAMIRNVRELAMPVAVHTIGDQALENVLDILDQLPAAPKRDRLIHTQVLRPDLIKRLSQPNRIADIQPRFVASDFPWVIEKLGEERIRYSYAWKTMIKAGILCAGGSDAPIEPVDPLLGIHAAVTRRKPGEVHDGWNPGEKLTMEEAFHLFTKMGAYATNEEAIKGTITRGKLADMTVFSQNPFDMEDPDELLGTQVEMTIIGGEVKYRRG